MTLGPKPQRQVVRLEPSVLDDWLLEPRRIDDPLPVDVLNRHREGEDYQPRRRPRRGYVPGSRGRSCSSQPRCLLECG